MTAAAEHREVDIRSRPFHKLLLMSGAIGVLGALLKSPITMAFIILALFDVKLGPLIAISIIATFLLTYRIELLPPADRPVCAVDDAPQTG